MAFLFADQNQHNAQLHDVRDDDYAALAEPELDF